MSEHTTEQDAQAAEQLENEAPEATEDDAQGGAQTTSQMSEESARKLRSENKAMRERLKNAEKALAEREKAELTDNQRLERELKERTDEIAERDKQLTAAEREMRSLRTQTVAHELGFIDPELAEPLLDWDDLDANDPKQVKAALRELLKRKPHLVRNRDSIDAGAGRNSQTLDDSDMNARIRAAAGR
jgi:hypothetical protein